MKLEVMILRQMIAAHPTAKRITLDDTETGEEIFEIPVTGNQDERIKLAKELCDLFNKLETKVL